MERSNIHDSLNEEEPPNLLVTSLTEKLESLSPLSPDCCIYRVPERLRESNEKAYTPRVVSIGPLHHGREGLQAMEEHKLRYLKDFVLRNKVSLEDCVKLLKESEPRLRNSYEETFDQFGSNEFLEMILVDAVFVIEAMLRFYHSSCLGNGIQYDRIFNKPWLFEEIRYDMVLLENQLPFFILEDLFAMAKITIPTENDVNYINDYFFVIDRLIDTPSDVELLVHSGIIENKLPDSQGVATFINNLVPGTIVVSKNFFFSDLSEDLNAYCRIPWHNWKATLKQDYFRSPWAILSIIAAVVLLLLTLIQTACSVISLPSLHRK